MGFLTGKVTHDTLGSRTPAINSKTHEVLHVKRVGRPAFSGFIGLAYPVDCDHCRSPARAAARREPGRCGRRRAATPPFTLAPRWDLTVEERVHNVHTHPRLSEALQETFRDLTAKMINC